MGKMFDEKNSYLSSVFRDLRDLRSGLASAHLWCYEQCRWSNRCPETHAKDTTFMNWAILISQCVCWLSCCKHLQQFVVSRNTAARSSKNQHMLKEIKPRRPCSFWNNPLKCWFHNKYEDVNWRCVKMCKVIHVELAVQPPCALQEFHWCMVPLVAIA